MTKILEAKAPSFDPNYYNDEAKLAASFMEGGVNFVAASAEMGQTLGKWAMDRPDQGWDSASREIVNGWAEKDKRHVIDRRVNNALAQLGISDTRQGLMERKTTVEDLNETTDLAEILDKMDLSYEPSEPVAVNYPVEGVAAAGPGVTSEQLILKGLRANLGSTPETPYDALNPNRLTNQDYSDLYRTFRDEAYKQARQERPFWRRIFDVDARRNDRRIADHTARYLMDDGSFAEGRIASEFELLPRTGSLGHKVRQFVMADIPAVFRHYAGAAHAAIRELVVSNNPNLIDPMPKSVQVAAITAERVQNSVIGLSNRAYRLMWGERSPMHKWGIAGAAVVGIALLTRTSVEHALPSQATFDDLAKGLANNT